MLSKNEIISGNGFKLLCDDFLDEEKVYIDITKSPKKIFLKTDWIEHFKFKVLPCINYNFVLVTHNADRPAISGNLDLLDDPRLVRWFGMNIDTKHPKLQPIPIGIANEKWAHGNKDILLNVAKYWPTTKEKLVYANFDISTNSRERIRVANFVQQTKFIDYDRSKHDFTTYLQTLKQYKYVISPKGNSVDCHRIWESIYLGVIPIIEEHSALEYFYDLPILVVKNFNDITIELLESKYQEILFGRTNNKAYLTHYKDLLCSTI